jgi:hypothetical protein
MDSRIAISRARLEHAEALLREVLVRDFENSQPAQAGSLGRMLVHIVNMNRAVSTSTDGHANVAKRLGDFANTTSRITVPDADAAARLERLVAALKSAKEGLEESEAAPEGEAAPANEAAPS